MRLFHWGKTMLRPPKADVGKMLQASDRLNKHPLMRMLDKTPKWMRSENNPKNPGTLERRPELLTASGNALRAVLSDEDMEERKRLAKEAAADFVYSQTRNYLLEKQFAPAMERVMERVESKPKRGQRYQPVRTYQRGTTVVPKVLPPSKGGIPLMQNLGKASISNLYNPYLDLAFRAYNMYQSPPPGLQALETNPIAQQAGVDEFGRPIPQQVAVPEGFVRDPNESTFSYFRRLMGY